MAATGYTDRVDPILVDLDAMTDVVDGTDDVFHCEIRSTRLRTAVGATEVRVDERPALFDAPLSVRASVLLTALTVVPAPCVEADEERYGLASLRDEDNRRLIGAVSGRAVTHLFHFSRPAFEVLTGHVGLYIAIARQRIPRRCGGDQAEEDSNG